MRARFHVVRRAARRVRDYLRRSRAVRSRASNKPDDICAGFPIAAVSSVTLPQLSPPAFRKQACDSRSDERRSRRSRGRHQAPKHGAPTSNAARLRRLSSSSVSHQSVNSVDRNRDAMLQLRDLSDGECFEHGASLGFAEIRLST